MSDASLVDWRKEVRDAAETVITFVEKALGK
jgi:hypothetical protein